jgi:hypothetical protein
MIPDEIAAAQRTGNLCQELPESWPRSSAGRPPGGAHLWMSERQRRRAFPDLRVYDAGSNNGDPFEQVRLLVAA